MHDDGPRPFVRRGHEEPQRRVRRKREWLWYGYKWNSPQCVIATALMLIIVINMIMSFWMLYR